MKTTNFWLERHKYQMSTFNKFRRFLGITEKNRHGFEACVVCHDSIIRYPCNNCEKIEREADLKKKKIPLIIRCAGCDKRQEWTTGHIFRCCGDYLEAPDSPTRALIFYPEYEIKIPRKVRFEVDNEQRMLDIECIKCGLITHWTGNAKGPKYSCCFLFGTIPPGKARHGALIKWNPTVKKFTIVRDGPVRPLRPPICPCGEIGTVYSQGDIYQNSAFVCANCNVSRNVAKAERVAWENKKYDEQRRKNNEEQHKKWVDLKQSQEFREEFNERVDNLPKTYQCGGCGLCTQRQVACEDCRELCKKCGKLATLRIPKIYERELLCAHCGHEHDGECDADVKIMRHGVRHNTIRKSTYTWGSRAAPSGGLYYNYGPEVSYVDTTVEEPFSFMETKKCTCVLPVKVKRWECDHEAWG